MLWPATRIPAMLIVARQCYAYLVLCMILAGGLVGMLAATGAFRWIGRAILLLGIIGILGVDLTAAVLAAGITIGITRGILEA